MWVQRGITVFLDLAFPGANVKTACTRRPFCHFPPPPRPPRGDKIRQPDRTQSVPSAKRCEIRTRLYANFRSGRNANRDIKYWEIAIREGWHWQVNGGREMADADYEDFTFEQIAKAFEYDPEEGLLWRRRLNGVLTEVSLVYKSNARGSQNCCGPIVRSANHSDAHHVHADGTSMANARQGHGSPGRPPRQLQMVEPTGVDATAKQHEPPGMGKRGRA